jgi:hypothetical protein
LHEELKAFNRIVVKESCVVILMKNVWIRKMIVTPFAGFPTVHAHHIGHFVQPVEYSGGGSDVADGWNHRVPDQFIDWSYAHVVLEAEVY